MEEYPNIPKMTEYGKATGRMGLTKWLMLKRMKIIN